MSGRIRTSTGFGGAFVNSRTGDLKALAERVINDRRFCVDSYHRELASGVKHLLEEVEHLIESRQEARENRNNLGDLYDALEAEHTQLKAEVETLRKDLRGLRGLREPSDAERRYRWLRTQKWFQQALDDVFGTTETLLEQDEQIDAAMTNTS